MKTIKDLTKKVILISRDKKLPKEYSKELFTNFLQLFFSQNKIEDFSNISIKDLYDFSFSAFKSLIDRKESEISVRVFNPSEKEDGFDSIFTFIEISSEDMPFLVDSTVAHLDKQGIKIRNIIHPIYSINRDKSGKIIEISSPKNIEGKISTISCIQLTLDKITSPKTLQSIKEDIEKILDSVSLIVEDWQKMINLAKDVSNEIKKAQKIIDENKNSPKSGEIQEFISWLIDGNFIFLGAKEFKISKDTKNQFFLDDLKKKGLGIFKTKYDEFRPSVINSSHKEVHSTVENPYILEILKSRYRSRIHRIANAERIRIQKFSDEGEVIGEYRFIGLFTSNAYNDSVDSIPLIRNKVEKIIKDSNYLPGSYIYKELKSILESYPRDEIFQTSPADLLKNATGIANISGRSQVKFFSRRDKFDRFVSCLIYMPKSNSNSEIRQKIREYLVDVYEGEIADSFIQISDSNLIRVHITVRLINGYKPKVSDLHIENEIKKLTKLWSNELKYSIKAKYEEEDHIPLFAKYKNAFSISYQNRFHPRRAAIDISRIEEVLNKNKTIFNLYKSTSLLSDDIAEMKIYSPNNEIDLSDVMPLLESFGFRVKQAHNYPIIIQEEGKFRTQKKLWIHYFQLKLSNEGHEFTQKIRINFERAISLVWNGVMQIGSLNRLLIAANLNWKHIYIIRAYTRYIHQCGFNISQKKFADILVKYHQITIYLIKLFEAKFNPFLNFTEEKRRIEIQDICQVIDQKLSEVSDLTEDRAIRRIYDSMKATLRTNYYQSDEFHKFKGYISLKFDSKKIPDLPLPLPFAEIFVYSADFEAIHLRGGKVARGGLRWSDRHEDFRTEVLGLVKAQMTKNAVIVPVGSKGGFVVKKNTANLSREEFQKQGIKCYKAFLCGLLDITDNVVNDKVVNPVNTIRYDEDDPYLVVAADKGTATFSDIANSVSEEYNFWLGDAFASGGSVGYDHKKMGITAKGAWVSVKRHFSEMGRNCQKEDFSVVGIGDMGGDVFGNGMLLSKHTRLIAAFNHIHIFIDPNPNAEKSFEERLRVFNLERSTWMDYDKSLISIGGGIYSRSEKSIKISSEAKKALAIEEDELSPNDLIKAILKAPVDLLWNGGIGTYVKAEDESDLEVGDKANDSLRINGSELNAAIVGEGGNLGFTQKGRIEYALNGGRINTDSLDNSAGVDCSDHEVNIKIALTSAMRDKKISLVKRNKVLEEMTDEVSDLVLNDNRLQTQAVSIAQFQGYLALGDQSHFMNKLENSALLNRKMEFLPSRKDIEKRVAEKSGLTRPELSVLLSYSKMEIYNDLVNSKLINDPYFEKDLIAYFPKKMQKDFNSEIINHQLRREIIATQITNFVVNRMGITFISQFALDNGYSIPEIVKAFIISCDSFGIKEFWEEIENIKEEQVSHHIKMQMFLSANKLIERSINWLLKNPVKKGESLQDVISQFKIIADQLSGFLSNVLAKNSRESFERKVDKYRLNNVEIELAQKVAAMDPIASTFDIAQISKESKFDLESIAKVYFAVGTRFSLKWLRSRISSISQENHWQKLSTKSILDEIYNCQMQIAKQIVKFSCKEEVCNINSVERWANHLGFLVDRFDNFIKEFKAQTNPDLSVYIVALNRVKSLVN
jgi:glutamate dehydrogenase